MVKKVQFWASSSLGTGTQKWIIVWFSYCRMCKEVKRLIIVTAGKWQKIVQDMTNVMGVAKWRSHHMELWWDFWQKYRNENILIYQALSQESEGGESAFPGRRQNLPKPPTLWAGGRNKDIFLFRCLSYNQWFSIGLSVCLLSGQVAPLNKWTLFQSHRLNQGSFFILCSLWGHPKCLNDLGKTLPTIFFVCLTGLL